MKILEIQDPDFYEWETHIFFDDAMEPDDKGINFQVNINIAERMLISKPIMYMYKYVRF